MEVKPGFKQTEVGVIPIDWQVRRVGSLCKLINGRGFKPFEWRETGLPILRIQNLNGSEEFNCYSGAYDKKLEVEPGQLLFAWSGSRGTSFGPHTWEGPFALLNYHTWKVQIFSTQICQRFLFYALKKLTTYIESWAHGASALVHVQKWQMEGFQFALPTCKPEQEAIAGALSDADALIESLEQLLAKKRQIKQGAMQQLLTGKTRLLGFTEHWETFTFGELFDISGGFSSSRDQLGATGYCYLHYGDIHTSDKTYIDLPEEYPEIPKLEISLRNISSTSLLKDGDVVFVDASEDDEGTSKHLVIRNPTDEPFISGLHTIVAKQKTERLQKQYLEYCFQTREVKNQFRFYSVGTKVSGISKTNIAKVRILVPTAAEQVAIASMLGDMDEELRSIGQILNKARQIKQGMMQELLTGRIRLV